MEFEESAGIRWLGARLPGARAAFTTRGGGVSRGPYESLNLGLLIGDEPRAVLENRRRAMAALGRDPAGVLFGHQVHGDGVLERGERPRPNPYLDASLRAPESDCQATANPGLTPLVQVADCLPVALAGERGVAMLHCGWRGLAVGIVERGVNAVRARAAAIGPGIGPCCYEVGDEVIERFLGLGSDVARGRMLDLAAVARRQLERAGVTEIESSELCTSCESELFFSHRRDRGVTGRQVGLAWARADA